MKLVEQLVAELAAAQLEGIFIGGGAAAVRGEPAAAIELLVRDTPLHRARVHAVARALACARVPLSEQARTIQLVGAEVPIHIVFGQVGADSYGVVRARAVLVTVGTLTALVG